MLPLLLPIPSYLPGATPIGLIGCSGGGVLLLPIGRRPFLLPVLLLTLLKLLLNSSGILGSWPSLDDERVDDEGDIVDLGIVEVVVDV